MFTFDAIARIEPYLIDSNIDESDWKYWEKPEVYLEIPDKKNVPIVLKQLGKYVKTYNEFNASKSLLDEYRLISFEEASNNTADIWNKYTNGKWNPPFMLMPCAIALLILLIACFNYTNTSIALAGTRIKEISLRKVMGSQRKHIIVQFLMEHFLISLLAVLLSQVFSEFITPIYIGLYSDPEYGIWDFSSYDYIVPFLGFILIFTTLISGAYPAFYISKLKTADALRKNLKLKGGNGFTYALLTLQMIITVVGIGMGIVFTENISYIDKVDKGYAMENVISIPMDGTNGQKDYDLFKSKIIQNPAILQIAGSSQHISWWSWIEKTKCKDVEYEAIMLPTGENYLQTMGVKLKQGRFFENDKYDDTNRVIINEKYMKTAGLTDPLNESVTFYGRPFKIIGVVGDFMQRGVRNKVKPMVITFERKNGLMVVQTSAENIREVNKFLESKWIEAFDKPYDGYPQLKMLDNDKWIYKLMKTIFLYVSGISLLLSLVGLYVLISLIINKKTKEIGIRKIMGAPIKSIIYILGKNFIYIFGTALLVGSLAGLLITQYILDKVFEIENHVDVTATPFNPKISIGFHVLPTEIGRIEE
ncbi:MAG: FtsX-like permease family protein [Bacteroidetes bacterium]|nr:MAG: FtsX-like permease family protein [Bacteroidota bacterium]